MSQLPDQFNSKRELDAWLMSVIHFDADPGSVNLQPEESPIPFSNDREPALDLLEEFCKQHEPLLEIQRDYIYLDSHKFSEMVEAKFNEDYKIDPLAVSIAIFRAYRELEE